MTTSQDNKIVLTLDAGGTNLVFSAIRGAEYIGSTVTLPSMANDLNKCLGQMVKGFEQVKNSLPDGCAKVAAISFAFPGPADYRTGIIGGYLPNFPSFREGVALGPFLHDHFGVPVFINNDGDLFAMGEATYGALPYINERLRRMDSPHQYHNILGFTFGTGLGIGSVIEGRLNRGNNTCVECYCLPSRDNTEVMAEDYASIRAIVRTYREWRPKAPEDITPLDIYNIAESDPEHRESPGSPAWSARRAFADFGAAAGDVIAAAVTLTDSLVVLGGGLTGAMPYIMPSLLKEMRRHIHTLSGDELPRLPMEVYDLTDETQWAPFAAADARPLRVYGSDATVPYDPVRRTGVCLSRLGASRAISLGAYSYAMANM